jgi:hypothetical protein
LAIPPSFAWANWPPPAFMVNFSNFAYIRDEERLESTVILYGRWDKLRRPEWRAAPVTENGQ